MLDIKWRETWPRGELAHDDEDYVAVCNGELIGRVYRTFLGSRGYYWQWFAWYPIMPHSGSTSSRREALLAIEEQYEAHLAGTGNDKKPRPQTPRW